jgi:hypothetical protein
LVTLAARLNEVLFLWNNTFAAQAGFVGERQLQCSHPCLSLLREFTFSEVLFSELLQRVIVSIGKLSNKKFGIGRFFRGDLSGAREYAQHPCGARLPADRRLRANAYSRTGETGRGKRSSNQPSNVEVRWGDGRRGR